MATRLTNEDFRRLVEDNTVQIVPEKTKKSNKTTKKPSEQQVSREELEKRRTAKKAKRLQRAKEFAERRKRAQQKREEENPLSKYRDLAKEIREGKRPLEKVDVDLKELGYEYSKYLGGDEAHTHLVKGLDYALLKRVREEMALEQEKEIQQALEEAQGNEVDEKANRKSVSDKIVMSNIHQKPNEYLSINHVHFNSYLGRHVYQSCLDYFTLEQYTRKYGLEMIGNQLVSKESNDTTTSSANNSGNTENRPSSSSSSTSISKTPLHVDKKLLMALAKPLHMDDSMGKCTMFLPGKMNYQFTLSDIKTLNVVPDTQLTGKENLYIPKAIMRSGMDLITDKDQQPTYISGWTPQLLRDRIHMVSENMKQKKVKKGKKKKEKSANSLNNKKKRSWNEMNTNDGMPATNATATTTTTTTTNPNIKSNSTTNNNSNKIDDVLDMDIFDDVGSQYVCDPDAKIDPRNDDDDDDGTIFPSNLTSDLTPNIKKRRKLNDKESSHIPGKNQYFTEMNEEDDNAPVKVYNWEKKKISPSKTNPFKDDDELS